MKHLRNSTAFGALAAFLSLSASAQASDIYTPEGTYQQHDASAPARVNWTGFYLGGSIGYGNANHDLSVRDYFKDYCDKGFYGKAAADETPSLVTDGDEPNAFKDLNRFFNFGPDDLENCTPPVATESEQKPQYAPVGIEAGDSREVASLDGMNSTGIVGDVRLGYDQQMGRFVFGVFGSYGLSGMEGDGVNSPFAGFGDFDLERGDDWSVGIRAGKLLSERTLLYILAAYTQTEYELSGTFNGAAFSQSTTFEGITVGGGLEHALTHNVSLGIEGTHTFYDGEDIFNHYDPAANVGTTIHDDLGETKLLATIKLKLNSDLFGN